MERKGNQEHSGVGSTEERDRHATKNQGDGSRKYDGSSKAIPRAYADGCTTNNVNYHILRPRDSQRKCKTQGKNSHFKEAAAGQRFKSRINRRQHL